MSGGDSENPLSFVFFYLKPNFGEKGKEGGEMRIEKRKVKLHWLLLLSSSYFFRRQRREGDLFLSPARSQAWLEQVVFIRTFYSTRA